MILKIFSDMKNKSSEGCYLIGKFLGIVENGTFNFENLIVYGKLNKTFFLQVSFPFIERKNPFNDVIIKNELVQNGSYFYYFPLTISACEYGQITSYFSASKIPYCVTCFPGTYSSKTEGPCVSCLEHADCSSGVLNVNPGYYFLNENIYSCLPLAFPCKFLNFLKFTHIYLSLKKEEAF